MTAMKDLHRSLSGAGRESGLRICEDAGQGQIRASVDVFGGIQHLPCFLAVKMPGQRAEEKDAVDAVVLVYLPEFAVKLLLGDVRRKDHFFHFYADH